MQVPKEGLTQKLQRLSASQQSIESVSSFCIFYHKDARGVVQIWDQEFYKANAERRLALLFLANHILQEGRKKGMGFQEEFFKILPKALSFISKQGDDKIKKQAGRLVNVWEERRVFGTKHIKSFKDVMGSMGSSSKAPAAGAAAAAASPSKAPAAAAAGDLGPVGEALSNVATCTAAAAAKSRDFNSSWSQVRALCMCHVLFCSCVEGIIFEAPHAV
jgi:regulator of Ty1 transposition protein 103